MRNQRIKFEKEKNFEENSYQENIKILTNKILSLEKELSDYNEKYNLKDEFEILSVINMIII